MTRFAVILAATSTLALFAQAQTAQAAKPAKYLWTEQITIADGKAASYPSLSAQARRAAESIHAPTYWIAASNLTGDLRRVTYFSFHDSFASIEQQMLAIGKIGAEAMRQNPNFAADSGQHQLEPRSTIAVFRGDLSYQPGKVPPSQAKYWAVTTIFLKAGRMSQYAEQIKEEIELLKRGGLDHHVLAYQVVSGLPSSGSAFYLMIPMKTLAEMDQDDSEKASTVFTAEVRRRFEAANQQMIDHVESDFLAVRPDLSRPPAGYLASDPEFWTVKGESGVVGKEPRP